MTIAEAHLPVEMGAEIVELAQNSYPEQNGKLYSIYITGWEDAKELNQYDGKKIPSL